MDRFEYQDSIKSKDRVKDLGEVYTPLTVVDNMLDLDGIKDESYKVESTFLEPACGNGNFLVRILARKLDTAVKLSNNQSDLDLLVTKVLSSIYGIDIMHDNIYEAKQRMLEIINDEYIKLGYELTPQIKKVFTYIMDRNIILGDSLTSKMAELRDTVKRRKNSIKVDFPLDMIINEWEFTGDKVKRHSFRFTNLDTELNIEYKEVPYNKLHTLADKEEEAFEL